MENPNHDDFDKTTRLDDGEEQVPASETVMKTENEVPPEGFLPMNIPENDADLKIPEEFPDNLRLPLLKWALSKGRFEILESQLKYFSNDFMNW